CFLGVEMKTLAQPLAAFLVMMIAISACAEPFGPEEGQPSSDQVATAAAMTLQALAPETGQAPVNLTEASARLPHPLYFLGHDNQSIAQIYRLERDGKTQTQLTFEPVNVDDYDVSLADGNIVYVVNSQLIWINADGSNRHILVDGGTQPVFSPDGKTLAY